MQEHLSKVVEGTPVAFSDAVLSETTDLARVRKIYKLNSAGGGGAAKKDAVNGIPGDQAAGKELEVLVLGSMALRGATN